MLARSLTRREPLVQPVNDWVHHGVRSVLLANEITDGAKIRRLIDLARHAEVMACVHNEKIVDEIARTSAIRQTPVSVLVEFDVGVHRCGVPPGEFAVRLARPAVQKGLRFRGLKGYEGQVARKLPGPEKEQAAAAANRALVETRLEKPELRAGRPDGERYAGAFHAQADGGARNH